MTQTRVKMSQKNFNYNYVNKIISIITFTLERKKKGFLREIMGIIHIGDNPTNNYRKPGGETSAIKRQ